MGPAVRLLCQEVEELLAGHELQLRRQRWPQFLSHIRHSSAHFTLTSYLCVSLIVLLLLTAAGAEDSDRFFSGSRSWLIVEALVLTCFLLFNTLLILLRLRKQSSKHIHLKRRVVEKILRSLEGSTWRSPRYFPDLHTPLSPCISLQWCIRDEVLLNIPAALLVTGDLIVMRPGHPAPGVCHSLDGSCELQPGQVYVPCGGLDSGGEGPQPRAPLTTQTFVMQETPIIKNLRMLTVRRIDRGKEKRFL